MSTTLSKSGVKPLYENFLGANIFNVGKSQYEERQYTFGVPSISGNVAGNQTRITQTWGSNMTGTYSIDDIYMTWQAQNSSTTLSPTFRNLFMLLDSIKLYVNGVETIFLQDKYQIMAVVNDYLRNYNESEIWNQLQRFRNEAVGKTVIGDSIPLATGTTPGVQHFTLPLTLLFPFLKHMQVNKPGGIYQLDWEVVFARNSQSLSNAGYILSNTTSNAYDANISYNNIRLNVLYQNNYDAILYKKSKRYAIR